MKHLALQTSLLVVIGSIVAGCAQAPASEDAVLVGSVASPLSAASSKLWKPPVGASKILITTCFENGSTAERDFVRTTAESSWEAIAAEWGAPDYGVDFRGWSTCAAITSQILRIRFFNQLDPPEVAGDPTTTSFVRGIGTASVIDQTSLASVNFVRTPSGGIGPDGSTTVIHEFGHILGFEHEFLRDDATEPCPETVGTAPDLGITGADVDSVMDADACGRSSTLSPVDKLGFGMIYGPWSLTNTWPVNNALRLDSSSLFVQIASGSTVPFASAFFITERTDLRVVSLEGHGSVAFGGRVRIMTPDGRFFAQNADNTVSTTPNALSSTVWRMRGRPTSGTVRVNDEVLFQSSTGRYLNINANRRLVTSANGAFFRILGHSAIHF